MERGQGEGITLAVRFLRHDGFCCAVLRICHMAGGRRAGLPVRQSVGGCVRPCAGRSLGKGRVVRRPAECGGMWAPVGPRSN